MFTVTVNIVVLHTLGKALVLKNEPIMINVKEDVKWALNQKKVKKLQNVFWVT